MLTIEQYTLITDYLSKLYDVSLYERHSIAHPIINYAANEQQRNNPDSALGRLPTEHTNKDEFAFYNYAHLHTLQNSNRNLFDGMTFVLKNLRTNPLRLEVQFGSYYDAVATCYSLEAELLDVIERGMIRLPMRQQYHRAVDPSRSLLHGEGRSAAMGGNALLVFNDKGTYRCLITQRSAKQATRPNALHVLPAFMFQPTQMPLKEYEWSLIFHVYRELLEELFGMDEDTDMRQHPLLETLQEKTELYLLGISMNLLTLRAEYGTLLLVRDADWWSQINADGLLNMPESQRIIAPTIATDDAIIAELPDNYYLNMPPQAIVALWDGVTLARELIANDT